MVFLGPTPAEVAVLFAVRPLGGLVLIAMLLVAMAERREWARIIFLLSSIYGCLMTALSVVLDARRMPFAVSLDVVVSIATIYALVLLFGREGNLWFRRATRLEEHVDPDRV